MRIPVLERCLNEIVRRHAPLRSRFAMVDGAALQLADLPAHLPLPLVDLGAVPPAEHEREIGRHVAVEAGRPFDLESGPPVRASLLRLDDSTHVLALVVHHAVFDGSSRQILERELAALYDAFAAGQPSPLPVLRSAYTDFAQWQRQHLQGEVLERQLNYWKKQLTGIPPFLDLPTDYPRPPLQNSRRAQLVVIFPHHLRQATEQLSRRENVTLFMTLLAAFKVLIARHTGQHDVVVGTPVSGRTRLEFEDLIGFLVNTLVLRTNVADQPSFRQLLGRVRSMTMDAYAHQELPFEKLVEELKPQRDMSRTPLFQVSFQVRNYQQPRRLSDRLQITPLAHDTGVARLDLEAAFREHGDDLELTLGYNADLFAAPRIAALAEQYQFLLEQIADDPGASIQSYSLASPASGRLLPDPTQALPRPDHDPVTQQVADWAARAPHLPAICQGEDEWTYAELEERTAALARAVLSAGVAAHEVVAVSGQRSFGLIAAALAVLRSRAVLLFLDPALPRQRQELMLRAVEVRCLIAVGEGPQHSFPIMLRVDPNTSRVLAESANTAVDPAPLPQPSPDDPAYIFFTSGTTGVPNAILGRHGSLSHFLDWQRSTFNVGPGFRCAQLIALSFDPVLRDIFLPLSSGATLCLPDHAAAADPLAWVHENKITLLHTVPSLANFWLESTSALAGRPHLQWTFFSGEPLAVELVRRWRDVFPHTAIANFYGPTEMTMVRCFHVIDVEHNSPASGIYSVGKSLPQSQALVLNQHGRLCGIGELGEVAIRTPFRTLGYLNAPAETSKRFFKNPFRNDENDLLFRTGDLGRYLPDGKLDVLGRLDHQIKIRGVRIEPEEVSAVLTQHPQVQACVVIGRTDEKGENFLAAYVTAAGPDPTPSELRDFMHARLPASMIPAVFVFLSSLPLTPNGKIDRKALPMVLPVAEAAPPFAAPSTPLENILASIWKEVLKLGTISIHDNFFAHGGHSLRATQVAVRVRAAFGVELPLMTIFRKPTIAELAVAIQELILAEVEGLHAVA